MSSTSSGFKAVIRRNDEFCLVRVWGELDLANAGEFGEHLVQLSDRTVVIDLEGLSFIDSSGFSALVKAKNRAAHEGRDLVLTRPQRNVEKVFEIIGLRDLIEPWNSVWTEPSRRAPETDDGMERRAS